MQRRKQRSPPEDAVEKYGNPISDQRRFVFMDQMERFYEYSNIEDPMKSLRMSPRTNEPAKRAKS
jgi:hypothetical protein